MRGSPWRRPRPRPAGSPTTGSPACARIGVAEPHPQPPHYTELTTDVFRHVAEAYGDTLVGVDEVTAVAPEHRDLMKGDPLRGVHAFYGASAREWWAPLRPGDHVTRRNALVGVLDKESEFAACAAHEWTGQVFRVAGGPLLSAQYRRRPATGGGSPGSSTVTRRTCPT